MADYGSYYEAYMEKLKRKAKAAVKQAMDQTWRDFLPAMREHIRLLFNETIDAFYADYVPIIYERTGSLYDILYTRLDNGGRELTVGFDPTRMTSFRDGYDGEDGLYDQVFRHGWHGGADKISDEKAEQYGAHPEPGTPYWREPIPFYTRWGGRAAVAGTAPLDDFKARLEEYQENEMQSDFDRIWNRNKANIKIEP